MKKRFISALCASILVLSLSLSQVFAETYFEADHFIFSKKTDSTISIAGYDNYSVNLVIPSKILNYVVVSVSDFAFMDNTTVTSAVFPDTLVTLGNNAFTRASRLESITIPENCNTIGRAVFQDCSALKTIEIKSNPTLLDAQMFYRCYSLESVVLPDSVEKINSYAFSDCSSLKAVTIPKATTSIASNAFRNCPNLTLYVYKDSYAQQYAEENNINFKIIPEYEIGDVDLNGIVNVSDATLIQYYASSIKDLSDYQLSLADVNGDGVVNVLDATEIQRILVGLV